MAAGELFCWVSQKKELVIFKNKNPATNTPPSFFSVFVPFLVTFAQWRVFAVGGMQCFFKKVLILIP